MELRNHPRMSWQGQSNWPPEWKGPYGPGRPLPRGEVGILLRVKPPATIKAPYCFIEVRWHDQEYVGSLFFDDEKFLKQVCDALYGHVGKPLSEIGSLDI